MRTSELSRTVGWFTSLMPVRLDPGALDLAEAMAGGPALGRALKLIKEQLRALPDNGLGYGLLRYLNRETAPQLAGHAAPQLGFNYLGRFAAAEGADWAASGEGMTLGGGGDPGDGAGARGRGQRAHARRERRRDADGELDLCAGADR